MDFVDAFRAVFALALTLGLVGLFAVALRRFGPDVLTRFQPTRSQRRMTLVESLVLDPTRRLVLVRLDDEERLILLGEGHLLEGQKPRRARKTPESA